MANKSHLGNLLKKDDLEKSYKELGSLKAVGRKYGVASDTIGVYMDKYGLIYSPQVRYNCNHFFFSTDTEQSFYLAGFIAADGCVMSKKSSKILSIGLSQKDRPFLELLVSTIGAENPIKDWIVKNSRQNSNWKDTWKSEVKISSTQICSDLARFNITERKSLTLEFPEWMKDHPLRHHFIRGYNDGDGSFYSSVSKNKKVKQVFFSLRGTPKFLTSLRAVLEKDLELDARETKIRENSNCGVLEYGGNRLVKKIAEYLYNDATICLERKKEAAFAFENYDTKEYICDSDITKEKLEESYFRTKSTIKTGLEFDISSTSVYYRLIQLDIPIFESPQAKKKRFLEFCTKEALIISYNKHKTTTGVAKEFGIGKTTAARYLEKYKII